MNRYKIDPWYVKRGLLDNLVIALRRRGYSAYAEDGDVIITDATSAGLILLSGYGWVVAN